jgi:diguanylate cyclase (GGDEF)-like protein
MAPEFALILGFAAGALLATAIAWIAARARKSRHEELLAEVARLARTDPLTGLANRRAWQDQLRREMSRAARTGGPLSVVVLDLDGFKAFNDRSGHGAGDSLLVEAATLWSLQIREMDLIARHGGDEFVVLLPDAGLPGATAVADRLLPSTPRGVTVSAGVAEWDGTESADELIGRADAALYEAKRAGGSAVRGAEPTGIEAPR